ncbi:hypothetical protein ACOCEA_15135 [Maribacter sp. CXY002]|uniref:hypothetical protein n=1 Tax=Maribacter luteocoastalis TaxID=3407671 RepID=UPI003B6787E5
MSFLNVKAQADCILGVGITDDDTLIEVFQMNKFQQENLANFGGELKYRNELLNNQLENIKRRHPQSNSEELMQLAGKYKNIMDSMQLVQAMIDKKVLSLFNEKQYELYLSLCKEASRSPFVIVPKVYLDSAASKQR